MKPTPWPQKEMATVPNIIQIRPEGAKGEEGEVKEVTIGFVLNSIFCELNLFINTRNK